MTIAETFATLRERRELAFMPYQTAGFPTLAESLANLKTLADCGADLLELGIPFSDPIADGPTIQHSSQVALENGVRLRDALAALRDTQVSCPLVLMSYLNPLLAFERPVLMEELHAAGVRGLIIPDLPIEEARPWRDAAEARGIDLIFLLAPDQHRRPHCAGCRTIIRIHLRRRPSPARPAHARSYQRNCRRSSNASAPSPTRPSSSASASPPRSTSRRCTGWPTAWSSPAVSSMQFATANRGPNSPDR